MLILAVDTSGKNGSLALVRFEGESERTLEVVSLEGGTFSAQLVPQISTALSKNSLSKNDIDGFAVASGPGSFTGLRVGLAAFKALAEILQKPIASVSLLEVISRAAGIGGQVIAVLDAGRGEIYVGTYEFGEQNSCNATEELGFEKIRKGDMTSPEALDATYIRRSDAEIMQSRRISR